MKRSKIICKCGGTMSKKDKSKLREMVGDASSSNPNWSFTYQQVIDLMNKAYVLGKVSNRNKLKKLEKKLKEFENSYKGWDGSI